ncbi:MAG: type II secretion system protein GspG [Phycisphaerales bacterium]
MAINKTLAAITAVVGALLPTLVCRAQPTPPQPDDEPQYMRITDDQDAGAVSLELSIRTLNPPKAGEPVVHLVGVAHIGQPAYYRALQSFLDKQDLVLFEGVGAPWMNVPDDASDARRREATTGRIRFLAAEAEGVKRALGAYPEDAQALLEQAEHSSRRQISEALTDAWGHPIAYALGDGALELTSLGADAKPGGDGPDADVRWSDQPPLTDGELSTADGIQTQLAGAAGLVFQLDAIDYMRDRWVNADMTVDELLGVTGDAFTPDDGEGGSDPLIGLLSGESLLAKVTGFVLKLLGSSEYSRAILRLTLIEMLGRSEELMAMAANPVLDEGLWERILDGRNEVVLKDLRDVLADPGDVRSIAVFYGSGHLPGLEKALVEDDGYTLAETRWLPAIIVNFEESGIPPRQGEFFRKRVSSMIDSQIEAVKEMAPPSGD